MENINFLFGITVAVAMMSVIAYVLGWFFTEVLSHPLRFRPFNCRPCLTFWLTVILNAACATAVTSHFKCGSNVMPAPAVIVFYGISGAGFLIGLISFLYIKLKFRIYD